MNESLHLLDFCGNCRFWRDNECRRFPPQNVLWATDNQHPIIYTTMASYPSTASHHPCCGEFKTIHREELRAVR